MSGSHDKTVRVWAPDSAGNWDCTHTYSDHSQSICCVENHGSMIISGANDSSLHIFDILRNFNELSICDFLMTICTYTSVQSCGELRRTHRSSNVCAIRSVARCAAIH